MAPIDKESHLIYLLPKAHFFSKGITGSTQHAKGFIRGLLSNGQRTSLCAHNSELNHPSIQEFERISKNKVRRTLYNSNSILIIIRYAFSRSFEIFLWTLWSRITGNKIYIEVNSLKANDIGHYWLKKPFYLLESLSIAFADKVIVVSPQLREDLARHLTTPITYLPNGHNLDVPQIQPLSNSSGHLPLTYLGTDQPYYSFEEALELKNQGEIEFRFHGRIKNSTDLPSKLKDSYKGKYDPSSIESILTPNSNILFLPYKSGTLADIGFPVKLSEYLCLQNLIVSTRTGVLSDLLGTIDLRLTYDDGDVSSLLAAIRYAQSIDVNKRTSILKQYAILAESLRWKQLTKQLLEGKDYTFH